MCEANGWYAYFDTANGQKPTPVAFWGDGGVGFVSRHSVERLTGELLAGKPPAMVSAELYTSFLGFARYDWQ